jgi:hypothetical protein
MSTLSYYVKSGIEITNTDTSINLLIDNNTAPHLKFTEALGRIFNQCARYYDPNGRFVDIDEEKNQEQDPTIRHLLSLVKFRSLLSWLRGSTPTRFAHYKDVAPLSWFDLELFLEFHDSYRDSDFYSISSLLPYYRNRYNHLQPYTRLDSLYHEDDSTHNDPIHYAPSFVGWDSILCCSMDAFCKLFIEWSKQSPRTVWRMLFAFGFNGDLDYIEDDDDEDVEKKRLASLGLCTQCQNPIIIEITRRSLICSTCSNCKTIVDPNDSLFTCC